MPSSAANKLPCREFNYKQIALIVERSSRRSYPVESSARRSYIVESSATKKLPYREFSYKQIAL